MFNAESQAVSSFKFQQDFDFEVNLYSKALLMNDGTVAFTAKVNKSASPSILKFSLNAKKLSIAEREEPKQ